MVQTGVSESVNKKGKTETIQPSSQQGAKNNITTLTNSQTQIPSKGRRETLIPKRHKVHTQQQKLKKKGYQQAR